MTLDDDFFPELRAAADSMPANPADVMLVLFGESGLNPASHRGGADYYGLNQMNGGYLRKRGIDPTDYLTWPASRQMHEVVGPFLVGQVRSLLRKPVRSAGVLEGLNLYPAGIATNGDAPDSIVIDGNDPKQHQAYVKNQALDRNHDGFITVADLDDWLASLAKQKTFRDAAIRLGASPTVVAKSLPWLLALALVGGAAAIAYAVRR